MTEHSTGRAEAETSLRRIDELIATLDALPETHARSVARELLEATLDFHGLALARLSALIAASSDADGLSAAMATDDHIAALLLLHGLHPELAEARVRKAVRALQPRLRAQGADVLLVNVGDGVARLKLSAPGASRDHIRMLKREIEDALVDAAPDLDEIAILHEDAARPAAASPAPSFAAT